VNFTDAITRHAQAEPDRTAFVSGRTRMRYAELDAALDAAAARLASHAVAPGDVVAVSMREAPLKLVLFLAIARAGAVSVSIAPQADPATRAGLAARFGARLLLARRPGDAVEGVPLALADRSWLRGTPGAAARHDAAPDAPWRISLSSGTTGRPKGVHWKHASTLSYLLMREALAPMGPGTRLLAFRDVDASIGLRPCVNQLVAGGTIAFARSTALAAFFDTVAAHHVTHAVASPGLLYDLVAAARGGAGPRCPGLASLAVGGASLPGALVAGARESLTPNLYNQYGASEVGLLALATPQLLAHAPECSGRVAPWVEAQAVDETGRELPAGESGELRFRAECFPDRFVDDPQASARAFRDGWFHPGDFGRVTREGLLYVEGRVDDLVNLGGRKVHPEEVERVLERHPGVAEAAAFGVRRGDGERLYSAVVCRGAFDEQALLEHCRSALGKLAPTRVFRLERLPRNAAGKVLRRELASRVRRAD
jgi:acyl-CoA synthetase (AMP-forming)/AMP-acid ligase II